MRLVKWISSETFAVLRNGRVYLEISARKGVSHAVTPSVCLTSTERFPFGVEGFDVSPNKQLIAFYTGTHLTIDRLPPLGSESLSSSAARLTSGAVINLHSTIIEVRWHPLAGNCCLCLSASKLHMISISGVGTATRNSDLHTSRDSDSLRLHCDRIPLPISCVSMCVGCHSPKSDLCKTKHLSAESQSGGQTSTLMDSYGDASSKTMAGMQSAFAQFSVYCLTNDGEILVVNPIVPHGFAISNLEYLAMKLIIEECIEDCLNRLNDRLIKLRARVDAEQSLIQAELSLKWLDTCWHCSGVQSSRDHSLLFTQQSESSDPHHSSDSSSVWIYDHSVVLTMDGDSSDVGNNLNVSSLTAAKSSSIVRASANVILRNISTEDDSDDHFPSSAGCLSVQYIDLKQVSQLPFGSQSSSNDLSGSSPKSNQLKPKHLIRDYSNESSAGIQCESPFLCRIFADGTLDVIWIKNLPMPIWNVGDSGDDTAGFIGLNTSALSFYGGIGPSTKKLPCVVLHRVSGIADSLRILAKEDLKLSGRLGDTMICPNILQCNDSLLIGSSVQLYSSHEWVMSVTIIHMYWLHFIQSAMSKHVFEQLLQNDTLCVTEVKVIDEVSARCASSVGISSNPRFDDWCQNVWNDIYLCDATVDACVVCPVPELLLFPNVVTTSSLGAKSHPGSSQSGVSRDSFSPSSVLKDLSNACDQFEKSKSLISTSTDSSSLKVQSLDEMLPDLNGLHRKMSKQFDLYRKRARSGQVDLTSAAELNIFLSQVRDETLNLITALKQSYQLLFDRQDWCVQLSTELLPKLCDKLKQQCSMLSENNRKIHANKQELYHTNDRLRGMLNELLKQREMSLDYPGDSMDGSDTYGDSSSFPLRSKVPSFAEEKLMSWMKNMNEEYTTMSAEVESMQGKINVKQFRQVMKQLREEGDQKAEVKCDDESIVDASATDELFFDHYQTKSQVQSGLTEIQTQIESLKRTAQLVSDKLISVESALSAPT